MNKKERKIPGVAWTLLDTEEHRLIMATRRKLRRLSLRQTRDLIFFFFFMNTWTHDVDNL